MLYVSRFWRCVLFRKARLNLSYGTVNLVPHECLLGLVCFLPPPKNVTLENLSRPAAPLVITKTEPTIISTSLVDSENLNVPTKEDSNIMTTQDQQQQQQQYGGFATKLSLFVSLCAVALLAVQNASLNTQVTNLQNQMNLNQRQSQHHQYGSNNVESTTPTERTLMFRPPSTNLRNNGRSLTARGGGISEDVDEIEDREIDEEEDALPESGLMTRIQRIHDKNNRKLSSKRSGSKSGKRSSKSSKRHCSSSHTMDSASRDTTTQSGDGTSTARCEGM